MNFHRIISIFIPTFFIFSISHAQMLDDKYYTNKSLIDISDLKEVNMSVKPDSFDLDLLNALLFHLTNEERKLFDKPSLSYYYNLRLAAQDHSRQMVIYSFFSHTNPKNRKMRQMTDRIFYYQDNYSVVGENIVENNLYEYEGSTIEYRKVYRDGKEVLLDRNSTIIEYSTYLNLAKRLMKQWMTSPPHKKNILSNDYSLLGCACALDDSQKLIKILCTQNFGDM